VDVSAASDSAELHIRLLRLYWSNYGLPARVEVELCPGREAALQQPSISSVRLLSCAASRACAEVQ
jgi:hypothetical protein